MCKETISGIYAFLIILLSFSSAWCDSNFDKTKHTAVRFHLAQDSLSKVQEAPLMGLLPTHGLEQLIYEKSKVFLDKQFLSKAYNNKSVWDKEDYDVLFYDLFLKVDDTLALLDGHLRMIATSKVDGLSEIQVQLASPLVVDSIISPFGPLTFNHQNHLISITPSIEYNTDEEFDFTIYYHGPPGVDGFPGIEIFPGVISTGVEPFWAHCWWPCKDSPADKPDSMYLTFEIDTTLYCASNGTLDSIVPAGDNSHIFYYTEHYPIAPYLVSMTCYDYILQHDKYIYNDGLDTMPIINTVLPGYESEALELFKVVPEALALFADLFGEYPFVEEKYGNALATMNTMEHQTMTTLSNTSSMMNEHIMIHELGHQWWGNMITCATWSDMWLNEGFTTYNDALWYESKHGKELTKLFMKENINYAIAPATLYVYDSTNVPAIIHPTNYYKGAWVLHMLRSLLGDSLFFHSMQAYYNSEYQYGSATTEQFKNVIEEASGIELDWFFIQWVYEGTYCPNFEYAYTWEPSDSSGFDIYMIIKQIQTTNPQVFTVPVDLGVYYDWTNADTVRAWVNQRRELVKFNSERDIIGIWFDPAETILNTNSQIPWTMFITTLNPELSQIIPGQPYLDTLELIGGSGEYTFLISDGSLPAGITLNPDGTLAGQTNQSGWFDFEVTLVDNIEAFADTCSFTIYSGNFGCCGKYTNGNTGNSNCDIAGLRNLADITRLIDNVYISKIELCCQENGNINGDTAGLINLADITKLIDHVYISKNETALCD